MMEREWWRLPYLSPLPHAERPAQARAATVVAARKVGWWLVVPVAIERDIPGQVAGDLDVVGSIGIELDAAGFGKNREKRRGDIEIGFVEPEKLNPPSDQGSPKILRACGIDGLLISRVLPGQTAQHEDPRPVGVFQVSADTTADRGLKLDSLRLTLQEISQAGIEIVLPGQEMKSAQSQIVSSGGRGS